MADQKPTKSIARLLLESARQDQAACALLASDPRMGDAVVGFHAQQAIEKSIKSVLSLRGVEFRRTHDVIALLDMLEDAAMPVPPHADWLDELTPYAVEARYGTVEPSGLDRSYVLLVVSDVLTWAIGQGASPTEKIT